MNVSWLKRSGIQKDDPVADEGWHEAVSSQLPEFEEVRNDKATPIVGNERGIPSVNRTGIRSRALPLSMAALVLAAVGVVWLVPAPKTIVAAAKDDPKATRNERFDENRPTNVLAPTTPPLPPAPPQMQPVSFTPDPPSPLASSTAPIKIIPAPDPRAAPKSSAATNTQTPPTPLELRQQSKALIVGSDDKPAPTGSTATAATSTQSPFRLQNVAQMGGGAAGDDGAATSSSGGNPSAGSGGGAPRSGGHDAFSDALKPTTVSGTAASKLADRTFMMTQGNLLDCSLDVAISSAVPGMTKCTLTRSIYGDDRKVVLLERGTELTGQYQGGMQQGQKRLFILWVRAKTPSGVLITLASPGHRLARPKRCRRLRRHAFLGALRRRTAVVGHRRHVSDRRSESAERQQRHDRRAPAEHDPDDEERGSDRRRKRRPHSADA